MFFNDGVKSNMSCALKVDTSCRGWSQTMTRILRKFRGLSYSFDQKEGMVYIQGKVDSQKIMRMVARNGRKVELCWMNSVEGNNYAPNYGPTDMSMSHYQQHQRGYYPPPPPHPSQMPYYQFDPMFAPQHGYAPQYGYPIPYY